jgi:hypothetical protein
MVFQMNGVKNEIKNSFLFMSIIMFGIYSSNIISVYSEAAACAEVLRALNNIFSQAGGRLFSEKKDVLDWCFRHL